MAFKSTDTNVTIKQPFVPDWVFNAQPVSFDTYMQQQLAMDAQRMQNENNSLALENNQNQKKVQDELTQLYSNYENSDKSTPITQEDISKVFLKYGDVNNYTKTISEKTKQLEEQNKNADTAIKDVFNIAKSSPELASAYWDYNNLTAKTGKQKPEFKANRYVSGQGLVQYDENGNFKVIVPPQQNPNGKARPTMLFNAVNDMITIDGNDMTALDDAAKKGFVFKQPRDKYDLMNDGIDPKLNKLANIQSGTPSLEPTPTPTATPTPVTSGGFTKSVGNLINKAAGGQTMPESLGTRILSIKKK